MRPDRYIFDIPIYRCTQRKFNAEYDRDLKKHFEMIWPGGVKDRLPKEAVMWAEQHFWENYGGPWTFNQVVGWIRLYILGLQVRGELWFPRAKKFVRRPRHRQFPLIGKAFESHTWPEQTSRQIYDEILAELKLFKREFRGDRFTVDLECFRNIGPHINWRALVDHGSAKVRSNNPVQPTRKKLRAADRRR